MKVYHINGVDVTMSEQDYKSYLSLRANDSHLDHINSKRSRKIAVLGTESQVAQATAKSTSDVMLSDDPKLQAAEVRQQEKRKNYFQKLLAESSTRTAPGTGVGHETLSFEQFRDLQAAYKQAVDAGYSHNEVASASGLGFQPTSVYAPKLTHKRKDGSVRVIRPLLQNEVGVRPDGTILILENKYPGDLGTNLYQGADLAK